jgi:nitrile hydratase
VKALESLLVEKGMVNPKTVDAWIEVYSDEIGPKRGAQVVARAWVDTQFKARLLKAAAVRGWAEEVSSVVRGEQADTHNIVVCTLCLCPIWLLGIPPNWYRRRPTVREVARPGGVLENSKLT